MIKSFALNYDKNLLLYFLGVKCHRNDNFLKDVKCRIHVVTIARYLF